MTRPLDDYVEVSERITLFYEKYPKGSLRCKEIRTERVGDADFLIYVAQAFRTPDDPAPSEGAAWEPVPGKTNFTRDSELMNAETSAWGRAIAGLGFEVKRGIASRQEVVNRRDADAGGGTPSPGAAAAVSAKQMDFLVRLLKDAGVETEDRLDILAWAEANLTGGRNGSASKVIDSLKEDRDETITRLLTAAKKWIAEQPSAGEPDTRDLEPASVGTHVDEIPF